MCYEKIIRMREAGGVQRCHTLPHRGEYSVAQHVYGMLILLDGLYPDVPSPNLVKAILRHDMPERWLGDIPGSAKAIDGHVKDKFNEVEKQVRIQFDLEMPRITKYEAGWLKALDRIEFWMWCLDEYHMGNNHIVLVLADMEVEFSQLDLPKECREFVQNFKWRRMSDY